MAPQGDYPTAMNRTTSTASAALALLLASCSSLEYDLSRLDFPVSATPAPAGAVTEPFAIECKTALWVHGLLGESVPDVCALLQDLDPGPKGIANFRVSVGGGFHDWLLTHLSATLVRLKSVEIRGELVR